MRLVRATLSLLMVKLLIWANIAAAQPLAPVEVLALFKDQAMLRTADEQVLLKVGQTSPGGIKLNAADERGATVEYAGETWQLELSTRVAASFSSPANNEVRINQDPNGQYKMRGAINGHYVNFLIDTGASGVALSGTQARRMGLDTSTAPTRMVQTAQGMTPARLVTLDQVTVGSISLSGVGAIVIDGDFPIDVLLGMTFLNRVQMQNEAGVLVLSVTR